MAQVVRAPCIEAPALKRFSMHLRHGFFGRQGGVSDGVYKSLNCGLGTGDAFANVSENRNRVCAALGLRSNSLATLAQVHSSRAVIVDTPFAPGTAPEADALVTNRPGVALGALAADCAPILLCDPEAGVIAAIHAGWRGAVLGVIESAVDLMATLGAEPDRTTAAIGPCLSQASFEVGPDLVDKVLDASPWAETLFEPGAGDRQHFDLKRYALGRLTRLGVAHVDALADDTLSEPDLYFSYRHSSRAGIAETGRNVSAITLVG